MTTCVTRGEMARYRIEFTNEWLRGRWGFIDRTFYQLGGKVTDLSKTENAWLVSFRGTPGTLGKYLTEMLQITPEHFDQFGTIFEILELPSSRNSHGSSRADNRKSPRA